MGSGDIPTGTPSSFFAGLFLLLTYVASHLEAEVTVVWGAPVLFTVAVTVVGFLIWGAHRYRHGRRLDEIPILQRELTAKDSDLKRKDEEIKKLTELLKEATEQKQIEPAKPTIKIYNTPSSPNEIIHPSPNGPLWRWDSTTGALGPFCPNHQQQRLGLKSEHGLGIRLKDFEKEHLSFNWFTCPLDDSEDFKFLKQHADRIHQLRTQATDRFRSRYGQKDYVTPWSGILEIKRLNSEVRWRAANGRDYRSLTDELPYGADLFLAIQVEITANPPRLVESILLNFAGKLINDEDGAPKLIDKQEFFLYFRLYAPIAFGKQTAFFVTRGLGPDATLMEKNSESFEVIIAGSIPDLQKFSGTSHQKATDPKHKTDGKPQIIIGKATLLNAKTDAGNYQTHIPLKIISPFPIGSLHVTIRVKTLIDASPSSSEHGLSFGQGTVVNEQQFIDIQNAYGDLTLIINTTEPITTANPVTIEHHIQ